MGPPGGPMGGSMMGPPTQPGMGGPGNAQIYDFPTMEDDPSAGKGKKKRERKKQGTTPAKEPKPAKAPKTPKGAKGKAPTTPQVQGLCISLI